MRFRNALLFRSHNIGHIFNEFAQRSNRHKDKEHKQTHTKYTRNHWKNVINIRKACLAGSKEEFQVKIAKKGQANDVCIFYWNRLHYSSCIYVFRFIRIELRSSSVPASVCMTQQDRIVKMVLFTRKRWENCTIRWTFNIKCYQRCCLLWVYFSLSLFLALSSAGCFVLKWSDSFLPKNA